MTTGPWPPPVPSVPPAIRTLNPPSFSMRMRSRRAAHDQALAPVRRSGGVGLHTGLIGERVSKKIQQAVNLREILLLRLLDSLLGQIVPQHVPRVDPVHAPLAFFIPAALLAQPRSVPPGPCVEGGAIDKELAHHGIVTLTLTAPTE